MAKQEQIYTIPVNDAFSQTECCPLCSLQKLQEEILMEFYLGPSLMEADHRLITNKKGFCADHLSRMYHSQKNRLGLGLMLHTHLQDITSDNKDQLAKAKPDSKKKSFFSKDKDDWKVNLQEAAKNLEARAHSCVVCDRLEETMDRYREVIFYQFKTEEDFAQKIMESNGFCLEHTAYLLEGAAKHLNQMQAQEFVNVLEEKQVGIFEELTGDVEWFTLKFDYKNQDKPWKNSKDALPRAIRRLEGESSLDKWKRN